MREIKFKAKRVDNGEWVYGDLVHHYSIKMGKRTEHVSIGVDLDFYEVIPETVCQFTGLKDKNGVEIYEGDIFHLGDKNIIGNIHDKHKQKQALIDMMRSDEELGLYDDNPKNHGYE